jgi:isocitrate dehydrogenase
MNNRTLTIPYIPGDGVGPEIMEVTRRVVDAAVTKSTDGEVSVQWERLLAGDDAFKNTGEWLPKATLDSIKTRGVALKGPLSTPVGGGIRSLNVALRQALDLHSSVRPVRYFAGVESPVKEPHKMNVVIFRENTEDVYKGVEWRSGSGEAKKLLAFLRDELGVNLREDSGLGIKPMSEFASKRLIRAAIQYAIKKGRKSVTLVHKGNIMKFTEGAFRDWGYQVAKEEFPDDTILEKDDVEHASVTRAKVIVNDRIADNMFQQILTRPADYSVIATPNLNGDYLADACAAQVGGLGLAPGANIGDGVATFEAVHGTAPKYIGRNVANPAALMLSAAMMLEHLGMEEGAKIIVSSIEGTLRDGTMTNDLARLAGMKKGVGTSEFGEAIIQLIG